MSRIVLSSPYRLSGSVRTSQTAEAGVRGARGGSYGLPSFTSLSAARTLRDHVSAARRRGDAQPHATAPVDQNLTTNLTT
jgi:hypothetical protein